MENAKVYIIIDNGEIQSIYSENAQLGVVVIDKAEAGSWCKELRDLVYNGSGELSEIEYLTDADF